MKNTGLKSFALVAALFILLSWLRLDPGSSPANTSLGTTDGQPGEFFAEDPTAPGVIDPSQPGEVDGTDGGTTGSRSTTVGRPGTTRARAGLECAPGKNGGATDKGVTDREIRLATTAVQDGPAKSLLADSVIGMKAVLDKVNQRGGICGRILKLNVVNDSFQADRGLQIIKNFIAEGYFALPVVPSAEGLGAAITAKEISKAGVPVIGTDGMREEQYNDPWVWPVASATVTTMRVMAKYGYAARGARSFAIVYDQKYAFGKEGKDAFVKQVQAMGGDIPDSRQIPLNPDSPSYASEAQAFNNACSGGCDMVAMLLLPDTAKKWFARQPAMGTKYSAGAQTLFTDRFAQDCVQAAGARCNDFTVWTGYNPPIGALASTPGVSTYLQDVRAVSPSIDVNNQFLEGAYLGMSVFVDALRKVGPDLTRERLKEVMDAMDFKSDLTSTLSWRPGKHAANVRSQAFALSMSQGTFRGWRNEQTGFLLDPAHGG